MSFDALAWAGRCNPGSPALKLVLLGLAECAQRESCKAWPSIAALAEFTCLNRKTIIAALDTLEDRKFITDTGEKQGRTAQVKVYFLHTERVITSRAEAHYTYRITDTETGEFYIGVRAFLGDPESDSYMGSGRWPTGAIFRGASLKKDILGTFTDRAAAEIAEAELIREAMQFPLCKNIAKEFQKRDRSNTVPKTGRLGKGPTFSVKQSQKRDTEPVREPVSLEGKPSKGSYAFSGRVIRLSSADFARWEKSYPSLDLRALLQNRDDWLSDQPEADRKRWFQSTSSWLAKRQQGVKTANDGGWQFAGGPC